MNSLPTPDRVGAVPAMRLPHQRPGADRGLSRGGPAAGDGVEASGILDFLKHLPIPLPKLPFDLF